MKNKRNVLNIYTSGNTEGMYSNPSTKEKVSEDSGYDIILPDNIRIPANARGFKINLGVAVRMTFRPHWWSFPVDVACMLFPRSSIIKGPLRMSNSIGLIDSGYRGVVQMPVDNLSDKPFDLFAGQRICQLVAFNGLPITVKEMHPRHLPNSKRGTGGFGSTGA